MKKNIVGIALSILTSINVYSQEIDYRTHAMFIYHFTRYIQWPESTESKFVIGVVGTSSITVNLNQIAQSKKANGKDIEIKKYEPNGLYNIIFVPESQSKNFEKITQEVAGKPVLLVTEKNGLVKKGACINLLIIDDKLKLEINKENIVSRNLKISNDLIKLAISK